MQLFSEGADGLAQPPQLLGRRIVRHRAARCHDQPPSGIENGQTDVLAQLFDGAGAVVAIVDASDQRAMDDVPVVTLSPGDRSLLKTGAHVILFPATADVKPIVAGRIIVGVNGTIPPM